MNDILEYFANPNFMPHGHCYLWRADILWTHVLSDLGIALAYYAIPVMLCIVLCKRRQNIPLVEVVALFVAFIFLCGTTHLVGVYVTWYPAYAIEGWLKAMTALVSIATVIVLIFKLPFLITLPGIQQAYQQSQEALSALNQEKNKALRLATENQQLAAIVQQSEEGIIQLSPAGKIITMNKSAKVFFDVDIDGQAQFPFSQLFDEKNQGIINDALAEVIDRKVAKPVVYHKPAIHPDSTFVYELKFSALFDDRGNIVNIVAVMRDISQLYEQREELRLIIQQAPNALIMTDHRGQIVVTNTQAERLFGYSTDEMVGQPIEILVPEAIQKSHPDLRLTFTQAPKARAMGAGRDLTAKRKDGSEVSVEIGLNPISINTGSFVVASVVDITERKRSQEILEEINNQLKKKNQEMEQFIYAVSHDLKSPLVTISGYTRLLQKNLQSSLNEKQQRQLNRIDANINHMETLLNDLLQLSRVTHQDIERDFIDSKGLIDSVLDTMEGPIAEARATVNILEPLPALYGNERLIAQSVQNLIDNGLQYRHPDRDPNLEISVVEQDEFTVIIVEDNGIGIEPKYFNQIFRIFERLSTGRGTGVGLAIVKTIVEKHHGAVNVESTPDVGSKFLLYFPKPPQSTRTNLQQ